MTTQTVACPQCNTVLRSKRVLSPKDMLRCPQCGNHFMAFGPQRSPASLQPKTEAPITNGNRNLALLLIPAVIAAALLGAGTVVGTYLLVRPQPQPLAAPDAEHERQLAEEKLRLANQEKQLAEDREKFAEERRRQTLNKPLDEATKDPPTEVTKALPDAKKALDKDKDKIEQEKLAAYQKFLNAGKAAMTAGRYSDALREFLSAQLVIPGDAAAIQGQKDAEKKLADATQQQDFDKIVADAKQALADKKYDKAIGSALAALRLVPGDVGAMQLLDDAKKAQLAAQADYKLTMAAAATAVAAKRYEEAQRLYDKALAVLPGDQAALKAKQDLATFLADAQVGQAAYTRYMATGVQAMTANRFADAAAAFTEALRLAPNDAEAAKGLADAQTNLAAIAARKADYDRFMALGADAMIRKLYHDATIAYRDALKTIPEDPLAIAGLRQAKYLRGLTEGDKAMLLKKYIDAIVAYKEALEAIPGDQIAIDKLSNARYQHGIIDGNLAYLAKRYIEAIQLYEEALKEKPDDANAKIALHTAKYSRWMADGDAALKAQKYADAVKSYKEALKEKPMDGKATEGLRKAQALGK